MSAFSRLIRFACAENNEIYFADLGSDVLNPPIAGTQLKAYKSIEELGKPDAGELVTLRKLLAPVPNEGLPIYCVGLNFRSHAKEAGLNVPKYPPLWTKPAASLAHPGEDITMNNYCAKSLPDYEAEIVFITARECKNVSISEAESLILGYTIGNDLSCRFFQLPDKAGGQFFYAKAFDRFAPLGPTLVSPTKFNESNQNRLVGRVNGKPVQTCDWKEDMIFTPAQILSHMSQGTAVMTGTPAGVGAFMSPKSFLNHGDVVEIELPVVGTLRNKIIFE